MWIPSETIEKIRVLNARREALEARRQKLRASVGELQSAPLESLSLEPVNALAKERTEILKEEISLRSEIIDLYGEIRKYAGLFAGVQQGWLDEAKANIEAKLLEMGYHPFSKENDPHRIMPGWILAHPSVRDEQDFLANINSVFRGRELEQQEERFIEEARRELAEMRDKALVGLR